MPYVKISDPNVIDLAAWHQVINVINQHSDTLTAITNNFGVQGLGATDWNSSDLTHGFEAGSQKIIYGKVKIDTAVATPSQDGTYFYGDIVFANNDSGTTAFSARPIVTATVQFGNTSLPTANRELICSLYNVQPDKFSYRVNRATGTNQLTGHFYLAWNAIGPK